MTYPLEPMDVGPAVGGDRVIAESDRQHVISLLRAAHAEGHLDLTQRDQRIQAAEAAKVFDDLVPLTRDLVGPRNTASQVVNYDSSNVDSTADQVVAILSDTKRQGTWRIRPKTSTLTILGSVHLDLTQAVFPAQRIDIEVFCVLGSVKLLVPPGTEVHSEVMSVLGSANTDKIAPPQAGMPTVHIRGFCGLGDVTIRNPKPSK